ncbi:hypothetical protein C0989_012289 [Termitomyces sp. Mn162]|nr:hypothetical protein C0989_012289 [Termitomyces sp. Mn162]
MSVQEAQFAMMRKRKRQVAIDPCLGFYCNIGSIAASVSSTIIAKNDTEITTDYPPWTPLPQDLPSKNELDHCNKTTPETSDLSSEPEPLTVEAFLRRNVREQGRIHVRKYGRKYRNRRIIQSDDECNEDDCSRSPETSGEVKDRKALFALITKKELVDGSAGAQYHPLSTWNTFRKYTHENEASRRLSKTPGSSNRKRPAYCAPLVFVPLADVEEAYNKKFHTTSIKRKALLSSDHEQESECPTTAPLIFVPADHTGIVSPNQSCFLSSPNVPFVKSPSPGSVPEPALEVLESLTPIVVMTQASSSCSKTTSSDKHLKPLGSFLEGFIKRVRAATQAEEANTSRTQHQVSTESFVASEPTSESGLEQPLLTSCDCTTLAGSSCSDGARRPLHDQPSACFNGHPGYLHANTINPFERTSLDVSDDIRSSSQEEFPPYVPPSVSFDINAALLAYTQATSHIQL